MTHKAYVLLGLLLGATLPAHAASPLARLEKACLAEFKEEFRKEADRSAICGCKTNEFSGQNFAADLLETLVASHEDDSKAEAEMQKDKYSQIAEFDYEATDKCRLKLESTKRKK